MGNRSGFPQDLCNVSDRHTSQAGFKPFNHYKKMTDIQKTYLRTCSLPNPHPKVNNYNILRTTQSRAICTIFAKQAPTEKENCIPPCNVKTLSLLIGNPIYIN